MALLRMTIEVGDDPDDVEAEDVALDILEDHSATSPRYPARLVGAEWED